MNRFYVLIVIVALGVAASADPIPAGWSCNGSCGTSLVADGVVPLGPSGNSYEWVTSAGPYGVGIIGGTNGSVLTSSTFAAAAGDPLKFYFNYVTSDGAGYADYAWVRLVDSVSLAYVTLFTARTTPSGNTVPGFAMPPIAPGVVLNPAFVPIHGGGPVWSPLGSWSGRCWSTGCGYTGWIESSYTILADGSYYLQFGTANWIDTIYDSGLAIDNVTVSGKPIPGEEDVPEPGTLVLLGSGLFGVAGAIRRKLRA